MRILRGIIVFLFLLCVVAPLYAIDDWETYLRLTRGLYFIDQQDFKSISCKIEVPVTKKILDPLYDLNKRMGNKLFIKENLEEFSLEYAKSNGLNFTYPSLEIEMFSEEGIANPAKVKGGINMIKTGFEQQIQGASDIIKAAFAAIESPKKDEYHMEEVKNDHGVYTAKYIIQNKKTTEIITDHQRRTETMTDTGEKALGIADYEKVPNGKFVPTKMKAHSENVQGKMEISNLLSFEEIEKVFIPTHISVQYTQSIQTFKQEGEVEIFLKTCMVKK